MTWDTAEKMWSRDSIDHSSPDGRKQSVRIRVAYSVASDDPTDKLEDVLTSDGMPQLGDTYESYPQIRVTSVQPSRISPIYAISVVTYEGESAVGTFGSDPIDIPPLINWDNAFEEQEWDKAFDDADEVVPLATANHEPVRGITERLVDYVALIERNYAYGAFDLHSLHEYLHSINSDTIETKFGSFPAGTARLLTFKPEEAYDETFGGYVKVRAEVGFRYPYQTDPEKAWWKRYLHEGYIMRVRPAAGAADGSDDRLVNMLDDNRDRSVKPLYLDEDGFPIADPTSAETPPFYREQRTLLRLPYSALGLF